jgi:hypothetical protein
LIEIRVMIREPIPGWVVPASGCRNGSGSRGLLMAHVGLRTWEDITLPEAELAESPESMAPNQSSSEGPAEFGRLQTSTTPGRCLVSRQASVASQIAWSAGFNRSLSLQ